MRALAILALIAAAPAQAETLIAARTIRSQSVITIADLHVAATEQPGALRDPMEAIGKEARVMIYAGRPIRATDLGRPALIERNDLVTLIYRRGGVTIAAEGRTLTRGGDGDIVRVMNLASRTTVTGLVSQGGEVYVAGSELPR